MEFEEFEDNKNLSLTRFEKMLKTNRILFFDSNEFENIISYYLENGKINLAKKAIKLGLEQHPDSSNLALFEIEIFIFENKLDNAEKLLDDLILSEPSNEEVYIQKANIYSKRKLHKKAIVCLNKILQFNTENAEVYSLIGIEYLFMEDFENAKSNFIKCLKYDDSDYSALYNIVYCFEILEQNKNAIDYLNNYLDTNPYCEVAWHQLGKQYLFLKNYSKAISAFDFAIISDEYFIGAYIEKGRALEKINQFTDAIELLTNTLDTLSLHSIVPRSLYGMYLIACFAAHVQAGKDRGINVITVSTKVTHLDAKSVSWNFGDAPQTIAIDYAVTDRH